MNLDFHPAVQRDVNAIISYYRKEGSQALADRFLAAMQAQLKKIAETPNLFSPYPPNRKFQRAFIQKFPHIILFRMKGERPRIVVIKHQKQHPKTGLSRW